MTDVSQEIVRTLPYLRRYARALTGAQESGDRYVRICLEVILQERDRMMAEADIKLAVFKMFHNVWHIFDKEVRDSALPVAGGDPMRLQIAALPSVERQVLLLVSLEGFSIPRAAEIIGISADEASDKLLAARLEMQRETGASVLIIEDESVIAMDIAVIVRAAGHTVVGIAATEAKAIQLATEHRPDLVLADVQLKDGDSGIEAVQKILQVMDSPVIFVTGFPERLLTGDRLEPAFVITKPFDPETLKTAISQALSTRRAKPRLQSIAS